MQTKRAAALGAGWLAIAVIIVVGVLFGGKLLAVLAVCRGLFWD